MQRKNSRIAGTLIALVFMFLAASVSAVSWNETGDAGNTLLTAQTPIGIGALDTIVGTIGSGTDTDVFRIYIPDPSILAVTMNGTALSGDNDTELYILDAFGNLVFNDDDGGPGWLSQANAGPLAGRPSGIYLVAYNQFSSIPENSQLSPVTGWSFLNNPSQTGTVQLNLTGAEFVPQTAAESTTVPEPRSLLLLGSGLIGFAVRKKRSKPCRD
jgi:hypothetical protein